MGRFLRFDHHTEGSARSGSSQQHSQAQVAALWELTDSSWVLSLRRPPGSARCPLSQAKYGEQRTVNRFPVVRRERAQESGQEPTLENEEPTGPNHRRPAEPCRPPIIDRHVTH